MVNHLGKYLPHLADKTGPLRELLSAKNMWAWGGPQQQAFDSIKQELCQPPGMALYNPRAQTTVSADASSYGLGAVLLQGQEDGRVKPVAYASRALTSTEQRYAQIEKEALATTWACERFSDFLIGIDFHIETDHKPLVPLLGSKNLDELPPRVQRLRMRLMRYSYTISHVPGKNIATADVLSRAPDRATGDGSLDVEINLYAHQVMSYLPATDHRLKQIKEHQDRDEVLKLVKQYCVSGWPEKSRVPGPCSPYHQHAGELTVEQGLLLKGTRLVIPKSLQNDILGKLHTAHQGIAKCRERAKQSVWWPGLSTHLQRLVVECETCAKERQNPRETLLPTAFPARPWEMVGADLFEWHNSQYLLIVDYFSRYIEIAKLTSTTAAAVIEHFKSIFSRHGIAGEVRTDNGGQFSADLFRQFASEWGFVHTTSSPRYPQCNGEAEKAVKTVKDLLQKGTDPYMALMTYRATPLANGYSPAELLMGRKLRTTVPVLPSCLNPKWPNVKDLREKEQREREKQLRWFNNRHRARDMASLRPGDHVWVTDMKEKGTVTAGANAPRSYIIETPRGILRRNRSHLVTLPGARAEPEDQQNPASPADIAPVHDPRGQDAEGPDSTPPRGQATEDTLSGLSPGTAWLISDEATAEFSSDDLNQLPGFNASFSTHSITNLSNEEKLRCSFEDGFCFWRQDVEDDGDWTRSSGPAFPPFTGPDSDHTTGNLSGHYIVTPTSPGQWEKSFQIRSLPLTQMNESVCLRFWYHMYGEDVRRLRVLLEQRVGSVVGDEGSVTVVFQKEGNYGDNWNSGQVTVGNTTSTTGNTTSTTVVFEAQKRGGTRNDIALDDISMSPGPCEDGPPEPTLVPTPTTPPPMPPDCGGPFDLWEPNSVFSSPNYPHSYGNKANCLWTLHAKEGYNIQLHFLDFDVEAISDMVEVRDGAGPQSELLGVFTGSYAPSPDVISTANQMTVMFFTDSSVSGRGFHANFTTGLGLGMPKPCSSGQHQCMSGECISNSSVCDSRPDCSDASDEAHCVHLRGNGSSHQRLQLQVQSSLYTACAHNWTTQMSSFACRYLGYRSGDALLVPVREEDSPFVTVLITQNSMDLAFSETCVGEKVVSLLCDNQPCGVRLVDVRSGDSSAPEPGREEPGKIVGGVNSQKGAWPWIVSLHWRGRHVCGASLIDNEWLVTAAHCVYGKNVHLSSWKAVLGLHSQDGTDSAHTHMLSIDRVVMSRHYNRRTKEADVAMMHLHTRVLFTDYIQPVCLPRSQQQFEAGRKCVIAGWGRVAEQGWVANVLQQATLPLLDRPACQRLLPEYNISASMVCAGLPEGGVDSCQGDSGGPLMCEEDGHWVLVGVTSFGIGCGRPHRPGVYALVSQFTDWIVQIRRFPDAGKTET